MRIPSLPYFVCAITLTLAIGTGVLGQEKKRNNGGKKADATGKKPGDKAKPPVQNRRSKVTFSSNSPLSAPDEMGKRFKLEEKLRSRRTYRINSELFELYVPAAHKNWQPYGLLVWMDSSEAGVIPDSWLRILDKYHLIGVGAVKAGSEHRALERRMPLAIDAVHNMKKRYKIDDERVYLVGHREAGYCASQLVVPFNDVFTGGLFIGGVTFWKKTPGNDGAAFRVGLAPQPRQISAARKTSRFVVVVGSRDPERPKIEDIYRKGFKKTFGSKQAYLLDVPEIGNNMLAPQYLDEALQLLDKALFKGAGTHSWRGDNFEKTGKYAEAMERYFLAGVRGDKKSADRWKALDKEIEDRTRAAKELVIAKKWDEALDLTAGIVKKYGSELAVGANKIKQQIEGKGALMDDIKAASMYKKFEEGIEEDMKKDEAIKLLQDLLEKYPKSAAAKKAKPILEIMTTGQPSMNKPKAP